MTKNPLVTNVHTRARAYAPIDAHKHTHTQGPVCTATSPQRTTRTEHMKQILFKDSAIDLAAGLELVLTKRGVQL